MVREEPPPVALVTPAPPAVVEKEPPSLHELLETRLFEALELWITRETLYDDAAEELAELRSIASRWLAQTNAEQKR